MSVVSAPGKVLIVGGYLVLDAENAGHVLAASARFHSYAAWTAAPADTPAHVIHVKVISVQFGSEMSFTVDVSGPLARPAAWCVPGSPAGSGGGAQPPPPPPPYSAVLPSHSYPAAQRTPAACALLCLLPQDS